MHELMPLPPDGTNTPATAGHVQLLSQQLEATLHILQVQQAHIERVEKLLVTLVTLTRGQEATLNAAIRARAKELSLQYSLNDPTQERRIAMWIRRTIGEASGVHSMRDIPRCEYAVALEQAETWERMSTLRAMQRQYNESK